MVEQTSDTYQSQIYERRWWTLAVLSLSVLIIVIEVSRINVALPTLQRELNASGATIVVITHNLEIAESFPRVVGLRDGQVEYDTKVSTDTKAPTGAAVQEVA